MKNFYEMLQILESSRGLQRRLRIATRLGKENDWLSEPPPEQNLGGWPTMPERHKDIARRSEIATRASELGDMQRKERLAGRVTPHDDMSSGATERIKSAGKLSLKTHQSIIRQLADRGDFAGVKEYVDSYPDDEKNDDFWAAIVLAGLSKNLNIMKYAADQMVERKNSRAVNQIMHMAARYEKNFPALKILVDEMGFGDTASALSGLDGSLYGGGVSAVKFLMERFPNMPEDAIRKLIKNHQSFVYPRDWNEPWFEPQLGQTDFARKSFGKAKNEIEQILYSRR